MNVPTPALARVLAAACVCACAGCGGATRTVIVQGPPPATGSSGPSSATVASAAEPPRRVVHLAAFQSPTTNIGCVIPGGMARCDIVKRSWSPPARPAGCPPIVNFGQGVEVGGAGAARLVCAGDTAREPASPRLAYGTASQIGGYVCASRTSGMTCTNARSGHGFQLSMQAYRLF